MTDLDPTRRFSDRAGDYARWRPGYPEALVPWLHATFGIDAGWHVADIGAGTGLSAQPFLDAGHRVTGVEPNAAMREAAIAALAHESHFAMVDGTAETTPLAEASIDLVACAQAFHWFDRDAVRREWSRLLTPRGLVAVYWNTLVEDHGPFEAAYASLVAEHGIDHAAVAAAHPDDAEMHTWFGDGLRGATRLAHPQRLTFEALRGRLLSSSHAPREGHPAHAPMLAALRDLFDRHAVDGCVAMRLDTRVFVGDPRVR